MKWKTLSEYPCNYEKKRAAVWKFKIERVLFMNSNTTAQRCYQQPQLEIMLRRTHTQKKTSLNNEQQKCVLIDIIIHMFLHYFFFWQSTCCRRVGMCIDWWIFAMPYSFSCIFLRTWLMLIIPFISSCSQLLHAGEFSWMYLLMNSSLLQQLANNVQRYCFLLEQICCLLDTFFTIKIIGPPPCPRGPVDYAKTTTDDFKSFKTSSFAVDATHLSRWPQSSQRPVLETHWRRGLRTILNFFLILVVFFIDIAKT